MRWPLVPVVGQWLYRLLERVPRGWLEWPTPTSTSKRPKVDLISLSSVVPPPSASSAPSSPTLASVCSTDQPCMDLYDLQNTLQACSKTSTLLLRSVCYLDECLCTLHSSANAAEAAALSTSALALFYRMSPDTITNLIFGLVMIFVGLLQTYLVKWSTDRMVAIDRGEWLFRSLGQQTVILT